MGTRVIGNAKVVILATCQVNFLARWIIRSEVSAIWRGKIWTILKYQLGMTCEH